MLISEEACNHHMLQWLHNEAESLITACCSRACCWQNTLLPCTHTRSSRRKHRWDERQDVEDDGGSHFSRWNCPSTETVWLIAWSGGRTGRKMEAAVPLLIVGRGVTAKKQSGWLDNFLWLRNHHTIYNDNMMIYNSLRKKKKKKEKWKQLTVHRSATIISMIAIHNLIPFYVMHACTGGCAPCRVYVPYSYLLYSNILVFYSTHLTIQTHISFQYTGHFCVCPW